MSQDRAVAGVLDPWSNAALQTTPFSYHTIHFFAGTGLREASELMSGSHLDSRRCYSRCGTMIALSWAQQITPGGHIRHEGMRAAAAALTLW